MTVPSRRSRFDVAVIGGGIAGAAVAAFVAPSRRVVVLERDTPAGRHATGRSAGMLLPSYGGPAARALTRASLEFFRAPPRGFGDGLLTRRPALHVASRGRLGSLARLAAQIPQARMLGRAEARRRIPLMSAGRIAGALLEDDGGDIDVARLHQGFLRACREAGGEVLVGLGEPRFERRAGVWRIRAGDLDLEAVTLVNAAGAWADSVAEAAGARALGLRPLRRTAILAPGPEGSRAWPTVKDADDRFYFRPCSGRLLFTACDEIVSPPCDAQPEPLDVARASALLGHLSGRPDTRPLRAWAGLRTFAADRAPVIGWSSKPGFFWLAGLGGFGVQTSPAAGRLAAALLLGRSTPGDMGEAGVVPAVHSPARFEAMTEPTLRT